MTSLCHLLQFLAIGVYAIMRRDLVRGIRGILQDRPVEHGRVALEVATRGCDRMDLVPSAEGNGPHRTYSSLAANYRCATQRGALRKISGSTLASELLVAIARDGLYDAVQNERDRGTGIQARRVSNTERNPRGVSSGFLEDPHRSMGTRRAPRSITRRSSIPLRRTLENGHRVA